MPCSAMLVEHQVRLHVGVRLREPPTLARNASVRGARGWSRGRRVKPRCSAPAPSVVQRRRGGDGGRYILLVDVIGSSGMRRRVPAPHPARQAVAPARRWIPTRPQVGQREVDAAIAAERRASSENSAWFWLMGSSCRPPSLRRETKTSTESRQEGFGHACSLGVQPGAGRRFTKSKSARRGAAVAGRCPQETLVIERWVSTPGLEERGRTLAILAHRPRRCPGIIERVPPLPAYSICRKVGHAPTLMVFAFTGVAGCFAPHAAEGERPRRS